MGNTELPVFPLFIFIFKYLANGFFRQKLPDIRPAVTYMFLQFFPHSSGGKPISSRKNPRVSAQRPCAS